MPTDLVAPKVLADRLAVTPQTVNLWARQGRIPSYRLSRKAVRFSLSEVMKALGANESPQAVPEPALASV